MQAKPLLSTVVTNSLESTNPRLFNRAIEVPIECCLRASQLLAEAEEDEEVELAKKKPKANFTIRIPAQTSAINARGSAKRPKTLLSPKSGTTSAIVGERKAAAEKRKLGVYANVESNFSGSARTTTAAESIKRAHLSTSKYE